jgi:hypothetical protein
MSRLAPSASLLCLALLVGPGRSEADPSAVCSPSYPITANEVEIRIYGAEWCGACAATEAFFASIGATDTTPVTVDGRPVTVRLSHLDVDHLTPAQRAAMRGDGVPEIHLVVRNQTVFYQAGAITTRGELDRFVDGGLDSGGCVLDRGTRARR